MNPTNLKSLFFVLFSLIFSFSSFSQDSYFGIKGGYNNSTLHSSNDASLGIQSRSTYGLGVVFCSAPDEGKLGIGYSLELGYMRKGAKIDHDTLDYKFHYINMPLLIDFYPIKQIKLSIGPEFSFLAGANNHSNDSTKTSILNTYNKKMEVSGIASISGSVTFFMDLGMRYSYSFTKISKYDGILDRQDLYNSYVQVFILLKIAN
ncbi:PorT family protein [Reichenbachiella carrageenanivorans]|uniref:PorT family protein n=1 Tax=Reichenbachiella carrageenanivorans TaxID=2979869 RepID=A0ABY6CZ96_9BACT|nr:PorT family protein [Reichenbachiella carrageenanivorans]UXX79029.1 PorT family protein [Reichenbachiella carrageenanivorans]